MKTKEEWIKELDLEPHVEGGYFRQTYKAIETVELPDTVTSALNVNEEEDTQLQKAIEILENN